MRKVFKYKLGEVSIPIDSKILYGDVQDGNFYIWIEIDDEQDVEVTVNLKIFGTGRPIEDNLKYINTAIDGPFIWHFYWGL